MEVSVYIWQELGEDPKQMEVSVCILYAKQDQGEDPRQTEVSVYETLIYAAVVLYDTHSLNCFFSFSSYVQK